MKNFYYDETGAFGIKEFAFGILAVIVVSILIQPMVEYGIVLTEKIKFETSVSNAVNVAKNEGLASERIRDLEAGIDLPVFYDALLKLLKVD